MPSFKIAAGTEIADAAFFTGSTVFFLGEAFGHNENGCLSSEKVITVDDPSVVVSLQKLPYVEQVEDPEGADEAPVAPANPEPVSSARQSYGVAQDVTAEHSDEDEGVDD